MPEYDVTVRAKRQLPPGAVPAFGGSATWDNASVSVTADGREQAKEKAVTEAKSDKGSLPEKKGYYGHYAGLVIEIH